MKKQLCIITAISVFFFSSCKKDPLDIPLGSVSASVNGNKITFNVQSKAVRSNMGSNYILTIEGYKKDPSASSTKMKLTLTSLNPISSGTFTETATSGGAVARIDFFQELIFGYGTSYTSYGSSFNPVIITITELTGNTVKGTYKGELSVPIAGGAGEKILLKDGIFNVSF